MPKHVYDCKRFHPDLGAHPRLELEPELAAALPPSVDLRKHDTPIYDQGQLGSCTGNALAGNVAFVRKKEKKPNLWIPSRLFIYYNERVVENDPSVDAGASISDGVGLLQEEGVCPESIWPYNIAAFAQQPPQAAYDAAKPHKVSRVILLDNTVRMELKGSLAQGFPWVIGFTVYDSFESDAVAQTGVVPMPQPGEGSPGGHAILVVGYDIATQRYLCRNSWGLGWGMAGYFTIPFAYFENPVLASDCWSIRQSG
jgi:C1A family cysteine protease